MKVETTLKVKLPQYSPFTVNGSPAKKWFLQVIDGLYVSVRASQEQAVDLSLFGDIDLVTCSVLANVLAELMDEGYRDVAINMSDVSYCDCSGIRVILATCQALSKNGGTLRVSSASPIVERIMEAVGLHSLLTFSPIEEEPLAAEIPEQEIIAEQDAWLRVQNAMYPEYEGSSVANN